MNYCFWAIRVEIQFLYNKHGQVGRHMKVLGQINYCSPTKIPNRDKKTESPYLVHPLTYRQVYLTNFRRAPVVFLCLEIFKNAHKKILD